jgi:hypothetical protein
LIGEEGGMRWSIDDEIGEGERETENDKKGKNK